MEYCEFLENYRTFTQGNETPENIHLFCGLLTLAGAAEKRLYIKQGLFNLYLNLYIILLGPAGVVAKSTSMELAANMLKEAGFHTLEGSVLKEKVIEEMMAVEKPCDTKDGQFTHSSITYLADELNTLLSSGIDMIGFLTAMFNKGESFIYKTKKSGEYEISYPYLNLIAADVPERFGGHVASDMGATGFLGRCILVYEDRKRGQFPWAEYTEKQKRARSKCVEIIYGIAQMQGEIGVSQEAVEYFSKWYKNQSSASSVDYRVTYYLERKTKIHVLKVAALMAIGDMRKEITVLDLERSIHLLESIEPKMRMAYIICGSNKLAPYIHQVLSMLYDSNGKIKLTDIVRSLYHERDNEEIRSIIRTITEMGDAKVEVRGGQQWLISK